jgi:hypothetical protein
VGGSADRANGERRERGADAGRLRREPMERMLRIHESLAAGQSEAAAGYRPGC